LLDAGADPRQLCADKARGARGDPPGLAADASLSLRDTFPMRMTSERLDADGCPIILPL
jgi:hypothetical protein